MRQNTTHKVSLGTDLKGDTVEGRLGVVDGLGTGLNVLGDLVVVAGAESGEVSETVKGDGVLGGREADSTGVSGDGTGSNIVRSLRTDKETVTAENSVGGEGGALEEVDSGTSVEGRLLVDGSKDGRLARLGRVQGGSEVELETLGNKVVELNLGSENVGGGPSLKEGSAMFMCEISNVVVAGEISGISELPRMLRRLLTELLSLSDRNKWCC